MSERKPIVKGADRGSFFPVWEFMAISLPRRQVVKLKPVCCPNIWPTFQGCEALFKEIDGK